MTHDRTHEPTAGELGELAEGLDGLAGSAAPGRGVDITRAMRDGRVRLRRRRLVTVGAVAVAAAATTAVSLLPSAVGGTGKSAAIAPPASAAPTTDPLVVEATYGWLPAGYQVNYLPSPGGTILRAEGEVPEGGSNAPIIWLKVYPAGTTPSPGKPAYPGGPKQYRVEAPPVDGRPAYWVGKSPTIPWTSGGDWYLRWQTADGRWAEMQSVYLTGPDAQQTMHRIAGKVIVDRYAAPLPYRISGIPTSMKLATADLFRSPSAARMRHAPWSTSVAFVVDGMTINTIVTPGKPPSTTSPSDPDLLPGPERTCIQAHGLSACTESQDGVRAYAAVGGPEAWLKKFTLLGPDEHTWTTNVLG